MVVYSLAASSAGLQMRPSMQKTNLTITQTRLKMIKNIYSCGCFFFFLLQNKLHVSDALHLSNSKIYVSIFLFFSPSADQDVSPLLMSALKC